MGYDKGPSLPGARIEDADFSRARLHAPNFEGAKITDAWFLGADISGGLEGLRLNGVEVAPLVEAELERRFPERAMLRATDLAGLAEAWTMLEAIWQGTITHARLLPDPALYERVDDEWSFVETLRHLVSATDCWLRRMIKGIERPYHPWGLAGSWLTDPASWGLEPAAAPTVDEVLAVRQDRMAEVRQTIAALAPAELEQVRVPPATPGHPNQPHTVLECLHVVLNEEWEHNRYAERDLALLEPRIVSASRLIAADADVIFELIADPSEQPRWDGNDNLSHAADGQRVRAVGDVFTMTLRKGSVRQNHVVEFDEGRVIAWRPSEVGKAPPGHLWRWQLQSVGAGRTRVTHTYDWTQLTDNNRLPRARSTTTERLAASLERLAAVAETR